jgi:serine protease inhibitor
MEAQINFSNNKSKFLFSFLNEILKYENTGFSPIGISFVLSVLKAGMIPSQRDELEFLCDLPKDGNMHTYFNNLQDYIKKMMGQSASILLATQSVGFEFANVVQDLPKLKCSAKTVQLETLNNWISGLVNNAIKDAIDEKEYYDPNLVLMLIDVFYFKDSWKRLFNPDKNVKIEFETLKNGKLNKEAMALRNFETPYCYLEDFKCLRLFFSHEECITFIMPHQVGDFSSFNINVYQQINRNLRNTELDVIIPKFEVNSTINIKKILPNIGVNTFVKPDFRKMFGLSTNPNYELGTLEQKFNMTLNEEGGEIAVITKATVVAKGFGSNSFILNKPFLAIMSDNKGEVIFSCVVVTDPIQVMSERVGKLTWIEGKSMFS